MFRTQFLPMVMAVALGLPSVAIAGSSSRVEAALLTVAPITARVDSGPNTSGVEGTAIASHTDNKRHSSLERFGSFRSLINRAEDFAEYGTHLSDIEIYEDNNTRYFAGVWEIEAGGSSLIYRYSSWSAFTNKWEDLAAEGYRLQDVEVSQENGQTYFTGIWRPGNGGYALYRYNSWSTFVDKWRELADRNLRLVDIEVSREGDTTYYTGVWAPGSDGYALYRYDSWSAFTDKWDELNDENLRLVDIEVSREGNKTYFTGIWRAGSGKYALYRYNSWLPFLTKWQELDVQGYKLVDMAASQEGSRTYYTGVWQEP